MNTRKNIISPFHGHHNHDGCQQDALKKAEQQCKKNGLQLTPIRKQVLQIIWTSHSPIGAYQVLEKLQEKGHKPAPPTAYRALDFLVSAKLVHRIESQNAYIGCPSPQINHQGQFYLCTQCGSAAEVNNKQINQAIHNDAEKLGFQIEQPTIEIKGLCKHCRQ